MYGNYFGNFNWDVVDAISWNEISLKMVAAAAGTEHALIGKQSAAGRRVFCITGDGAIDLSVARSLELVGDNQGAVSDEARRLATGMRTYFTNIPAVADGAQAIAFALSLGQISDVAGVALSWAKRGAAKGNLCGAIENVSSVVSIRDAALSGGNALLLDDGVTGLATSDTLVVMPKFGIVFGYIVVQDALFAAASLAFNQGTSDATAVLSNTIVNVPEAADILTLKAMIK